VVNTADALCESTWESRGYPRRHVGIPDEGLALPRQPDRGLRAAVAKGDDADRTSTEAWLVAWLTGLAPGRSSANRIANDRWAFEKWVLPNVGRIPLADFGPGDLE